MPAIFKKILPHVFVLIGFVIISIAYFYPVLQGKEIFQSDIVQYIGMARQQNDFRETTQEEPYWTDAAFGGMPTFQLGAHYPHNYIKSLDSALRFLPRPADYLFLYFLGIYLLLLVLRCNYKLAFLGALAFGFSTYLIIILGVGHNAKAHAIAYFPWVLGGILLCFNRKYISGFLLLAFGMGLEIQANHFQMTYYLLLLVLVLGVVYLIKAIGEKELPNFFKAIGTMVVAVILALGLNATNLLATKEYTAFSTRGDSNLNIDPDGSSKQTSGLDFNYITEYSYGILESFNLFSPRFMGGSSGEKLDEKSNVYSELVRVGVPPVQAQQFVKSAPTYWGNQPFVGAPAYLGAGVLFLFIFALYLVKGRLKWWLVGGSILALLLSWGKNFGFLTELFIDYVPLYDKFRAVSSIQVLIELCVPVLAILGLKKLFSPEETEEHKWHALKWSSIILGGISLVFLLFKSILFDFSGISDSQFVQQLGPGFIRALKQDRKALFTADLIRSLIFVGLLAGCIYLYLKRKLNKNWTIAIFAILILIDLVGVDRRYVNEDDFVNAMVMKKPFQANQADLKILQDSTHYRVLDLSESPFNTGRTSYFHNSIGGYHAAKPARMQNLFDYYISQNKLEVLNMLNTKYFILSTEDGVVAQQNPDANGNAWFVENVSWTENETEAFLALSDTDTKKTAIIDSEFKKDIPESSFPADGVSSIKLIKYLSNEVDYESSSESEKLAVFSEVYYPHGWKVYIDGKEHPHFQVDYILRGMVIPAGKHIISFKFEPQVIKTGSTIALLSSILLIFLVLGSLYYSFQQRKK